MVDTELSEDDNSKIVTGHGRRVVHEVLSRLVVKHTPLIPDGQEAFQLASLGTELPLAMAEAIDDPNPLIGLLAAWMVLKLTETKGPHAPKQKSSPNRAKAVLIGAIKEEKPALTLYALILLSNGSVPEEAVPWLTPFLGHADSAVAVYAACALTWCGEFGAPAVPVLTKALHGDEELLGTIAANALGRMGLRNQEAISVLIRRLSEAESPYQYSIILALKGLGTKAASASPKLLSIVRNNQLKSLIRAAAADALASVQQPTPETQRLLVKLLSENDSLVIEAGIRGLERSGGLPDEVLPRLFELLQSSDIEHRRIAALGFRLFGRTAEVALKELIEATCREENREVLVELATTCAFLGHASAKPLCEVIRQGKLHLMGGACVALQLMGKVAAHEIAQSLLSDADEVVRRTGVALLKTLGPDVEPALANLIAMLPTLDDERTLDALEVISNCETGIMSVAPSLVSCLLERKGVVSKAAGTILARLGTPVVPMLEERMLNASTEHQRKIKDFLKSLHPAQEFAFGRLLALNADQDLLLFLFVGEIIERAGSIGLRKVAGQLEKVKAVDDLNLPASEASVRMMLSELNRKLPVTVTQQTAKGTCLKDEGRSLLREAREYLRWRGFSV